MPSPFPCSPVTREWSWKKIQIEKKKKGIFCTLVLIKLNTTLALISSYWCFLHTRLKSEMKTLFLESDKIIFLLKLTLQRIQDHNCRLKINIKLCSNYLNKNFNMKKFNIVPKIPLSWVNSQFISKTGHNLIMA